MADRLSLDELKVGTLVMVLAHSKDDHSWFDEPQLILRTAPPFIVVDRIKSLYGTDTIRLDTRGRTFGLFPLAACTDPERARLDAALERIGFHQIDTVLQ